MIQFSLAFTEFMGNIKSQESNQEYHTISNKTDAWILTSGFIRRSDNYYYYYLIPICIINIIIDYYYFNDNEYSNLMELPLLKLSSLKVGDKIDARDDWEKYYVATILYIKKKNDEFPINNNVQRLSVSPGIKYLYPSDWHSSLAIFIHYDGCSSRYDEWIFVKKHTICDCKDICHYKDIHFVAKHHTQSKQIGLKQVSKFSIPKIKNCAGLANIGNCSWLNSIIQCLYHTKQFKKFIINGNYQYQHHHHKYHKNKRYYQQFKKNNQFLFKLHDLFCNLQSNEFSVASPVNLEKIIFSDTKKNNKKSNPLIFEQNTDKTYQFLMWIINKLSNKHEIIKNLFQGRYQIEYKQKCEKQIYEKQKIYNNDISNNKQYSFLSLELPIINGMTREFVIDVYDSRNNNNSPIRHYIKLRRNGKVSDLEDTINKLYSVQSDHESTFFYRLWGFRCCYVWNSFEPLTDVDDNIACYIIKNWSPTNHICHIHHVRPINKPELDDNDNDNPRIHHNHDNYAMDIDTDSDTDYDYEQDQDDECKQNNNNNNSILKHHYHHHCDVHMNDKHVIHPFAFGQPFIISFPHNQTTGRLVHKIIYDRLYNWIGNKLNKPQPPPILDEDNVNEDIESEWDVILVNLPYTLRWVHKDYNFYFDGYKPPIVTPDAVPINYTWNYHANIVIEWDQEFYEIVKPLFNKIKDSQQRKKCVHDPQKMTIYDCIDQYIKQKLDQDNNNDNDNDNDKELRLWALPEVLILSLPRFYSFTVERLNKCQTRRGFIPSLIEYPLNNLDLSKYMSDELTMNSKYDLYSVCCHSGTNHFYTLCKKEDDNWYKFEDNKITKIDKSSVVNNKALILFYKKTPSINRLANHSMFDKYF